MAQRRRLFPCALAALALAGAARADTTLEDFRSAYPEPVEALGGQLQEGEVEAAFAISQAIRGGLERRFAGGPIRRDAHPKAHGCVRARFEVASDLEPRLARGMLRPGASYPAWIRFSNGDEDPERADGEGDGRGMAIKLMGVPGAPMFGEAPNHDLIMISHPTFLVNEADDYLSLIETVNSDSRVTQLLEPVLVPWAIGLRGTRIALATTSKVIANPLEARYWSMVPYALGTGEEALAVKFSARACGGGDGAPPEDDDPAPGFLRTAMAETLAAGDACMEFLVQPRTSPEMSIEDSQTEWTEAEAPFVRVATIAIPAQSFATPAQDAFCESLSFNPWRAAPEHRPLGAVNRMRKVIYDAISAFRRGANDAPTDEPEPGGDLPR